MLKDYINLTLPDNHQVVLIDSETDSDKVKSREIFHIPLIFWIVYSDNTPAPPPLQLLINPTTFNYSTTKKINPNYTRSGYVVEEWGEYLDVITMSGTIGGYFIKYASSVFSGLNRYDKRRSPSFQNLQTLFLTYRNNGNLYTNTVKSNVVNTNTKLIQAAKTPITERVPKTLENPKNRISKVGSVYMYYDKTVYEGSFDEFNIEENAEKPYNLNYGFKFTVRHRNTSDSRTYQYYNQVMLESGDVSKNVSQTRRILKEALNIETNSNFEQESISAPPKFTENYNSMTLPSQMANYSVKLLEINKYRTTGEDRVAFESTYKALTPTEYAKNQKVKENINTLNIDIISRVEKNSK